MSVDPNNICRCCGSIHNPENLFNLRTRSIKLPGENQSIDLEKWFLDFTNLNPLTYKSDFDKMCITCETQLLKAYEFRSALLLAELSFATETGVSLMTNTPLTIEENTIEKTVEKTIASFELPPGLKLEVRKAIGVPQSDHQYEATPKERKAKVACLLCGAKFRTRKALAVHAKRHNQIYTCDEPNCGERFKAKSLLVYHQNHHKEMAKRLVCPTCGKRYDSEEMFAQHTIAHEETTGIACEDCEKSFILLQSLMHHQKNEHPKRQCNLCRRSYSAGRSLKLHMLQHAGIKFMCDLCDMEFDDHITLLAHLKNHPEGRVEFDEERHIVIPENIQKKMDFYEGSDAPFSCTGCKKKYKTKDELQEHRKTEWCGGVKEPVMTQTTNNGVVVMFDVMDDEIDYILEETIEDE